jgi:hypothetical protein
MAIARTMKQRKEPPDEQEQRAIFLKSLAKTANVSRSCVAAKLPRTLAYEWRNTDEVFAADWDKALEQGIDALEDEVTRRGKDGVLKPQFYKGNVCGHVREYSDTLLIFKLKGWRPDRYRERLEHTGRNGGPIETVDLGLIEAARRIAFVFGRGLAAVNEPPALEQKP